MEKQVQFLEGVSMDELAVIYKLADILYIQASLKASEFLL
jgi:hypothetical protein